MSAEAAEIHRKLVIKQWPIERLIPYANNARTHSDAQVEQLVASMKEFGWTAPILVDEAGNVIAGHGRLLAAQRLELPHVPVIVAKGWSEAQRRAYTIADNKLALNANWDDNLLALELGALKEFTFDLALTGFNSRELRRLTEPAAEQQAQPNQYSDEQIIDAAFTHFRALGFPYPSLTVHECMQQINALRASSTDNLLRSPTAYQVADTFHRHRYEGKCDGMKSPLEGFADDKILRRILAFAISQGVQLPAHFFGQLHLMSGVQECANFRPGFAAYIYRRFCEPGARVLDTSTGYGGRIVGAIGSGVVREYVGIDPSTLTHVANLAMLQALGDPLEVRLHNQPAEDVSAFDLDGAFDFSFTSPPYFSKERYSEEPTQSWRRYPTGESWRDGFLARMLALQFAALKPDALNLVNIEDVLIKGHTYPLVEWTRAAGIAAGFEFESMEQFPLAASNWVAEEGVERFEHVLVFRKPSGAR
jgi:ParB-like chromosome segregation protein Spo0J